ncbi:EAL domain-containing protein [Bradyrhizobium lablabi]|nr:EAL domain-containing protein [Bradyrhizobium lablabi]MBR1124562.1 EAL domain-containing protein [Bradyrhizobium lablabi]
MSATPSRPAAIARSFATTVRGPALWLTLCGGLLVTAIFAVTIMMVGQFRERALVNSERELKNTVLLLTRHFDQQFEDSKTIAGDLVAQLQVSRIASPEAFRQRMLLAETHEILKYKGLSYLGDVSVFDAEGDLLTWSRALPAPALNISERNYFRTFKSDPQSRPVLAEAVRSLIRGKLQTVIAHRLTGENGIFLGVMTRRIEPAQYEKFFASVAPGSGAAISMFHADGTLMARFPHVDHLIGQNFATAPLLQHVLNNSGPQTLRVQSPVDGKERLGSAAMLSQFPGAVVATNTLSAALADWRAQTRLMVGAAGLAALVIALVLFVIIRQMLRHGRESQERLRTQKQQLDTALNNMTQGLVLYDGSERLVLCNERFIDMFGLSRDVVKPGADARAIMHHRVATGSFEGDPDGFYNQIQRSLANGEVTTTIANSICGRWFQIVNQPLAQGGWVATIEEITERRKLEQERDRNQAFLREIIDHIPSQITVKDVRERRYVLVNRVAETHFGVPREAILGKTAPDLFPPRSAEIIAADDETTLQSPEGMFKDEHVWESQAVGKRFITSRRLAIRDKEGEARYLINIVDDVTERRRAHERIAHLAHYDPLTDLPNRVLFCEQIERELQKVSRGEQFALLYIDVDEFKGINDSLGHHVGDELLKAVAGRLRACIRETDLIARLGGDEFAVIQTGVKNVTDVLEFVTRIYEAIRKPYQCLGHHLSTDASIGIAMAPQDGTNLDQLIKNADLAMYGAKADGRRTYRFFEPEMDASAKARLAMEQDLRQAIREGGFEIHYQPLVCLKTDSVTGCEALLRWRHAERGMISPAEFIPVLEDTGLVNELGEWVLRTACTEAAGWPDHVRLAVNVSPVQLKCEGLALKIASALASSGLPANRLELEITEAVLIHDDEAALAILHQLRAIGVRIALDDFGTGYSSLSYLKRFPFDKIKIDRCFVTDLAEMDSSAAIVQAVVNIAASRNMTTVAEGVETIEQKGVLRALGCTQMQGFLFSAARPGPEVRKLFSAARAAVVAA